MWQSDFRVRSPCYFLHFFWETDWTKTCNLINWAPAIRIFTSVKDTDKSETIEIEIKKSWSKMVKCDFCGEKDGNKSCSICKHAIYCSLNCQKSHWSKHKKRKRSKWQTNILISSALIMLNKNYYVVRNDRCVRSRNTWKLTPFFKINEWINQSSVT